MMDWDSFGVVRFDLGPLFQGQLRIAKLKIAYNSLIIGPTGLGWKINLQEIMGWESFGVVGFDLGPLLQGRTRILYLQYFFKYVLTYFLHLNSYLVTFLHNTICRAQLLCPFLLSASEFLSNMLLNYHLLYYCTALCLIIMLSSPYHLHKSKTLS